MTESNQIWKTSRPRKGHEVTCDGRPFGVVHRVEGNLCWVRHYEGDKVLPFIWCHPEGVNNRCNWPTKVAGDEAVYS